MTSYKLGGHVIPLTERNGAPRHEDDKLARLIQHAVKSATEERDETLISELRGLTDRVVRGFERLSENLEAYVSGNREVAVACMVDTPSDDLPGISRMKADSTLVFTMSATEIAEHVGLSVGDVSYLLSQPHGLDWVHRKPELWNQDLFLKTRRRLWHPKTAELLLEVFRNPKHIERNDLTAGCIRILDRAPSA